jgi:hypothetical protein
MWTSRNLQNQTAYILTFMMGAQELGAVSDAKAAKVKTFLKIDQIHANQ